MSHLRYLNYVLRHKLLVLRAWIVLAVEHEYTRREWATMLWRALVHDLSKFGPTEWFPYVAMFYGEPVNDIAFREFERAVMRARNANGGVIGYGHHEELKARELDRRAELKRDRQAAFNYAWLHHQHANPHHWQHWILKEDSGKTIVLLPHRMYADEMLADWMAAGPKALRAHTMADATRETIAWYAKVHDQQVMRTHVRDRIETGMLMLANRYGIAQHAAEVRAAAATRVSLTIPGR